MSSLRDVEVELFTTIKTRLLPYAKREEETFFNILAADALLLTTTIEQLKNDTLRSTFIELISLAFLAPEKFFAVSEVIKIAVMMGGDDAKE